MCWISRQTLKWKRVHNFIPILRDNGKMSLTIKSEEDWNTLMANPDLTYVVDFTATWCGPCRVMGPYFEELAKKPEFAKLAFLKVDVDEVEAVASAANVSAMPTFQVWQKGAVVKEFVGANKEKLVSFLHDALARL